MAKLPGEGTLLQIESAIPGTYTTITQRLEIDGPDAENEAVETGDLDSAAEEYRPSLIPDHGTVSLTIYYDPANTVHTTLKNHCQAPTTVTPPNFRLVYNNVTNSRPHDQFAAVVIKFKRTGQKKRGMLMAELELKISGPIATGTTTIP